MRLPLGYQSTQFAFVDDQDVDAVQQRIWQYLHGGCVEKTHTLCVRLQGKRRHGRKERGTSNCMSRWLMPLKSWHMVRLQVLVGARATVMAFSASSDTQMNAVPVLSCGCAHHIQHHARLTQRYFDRIGKRIGPHGAQKSGGNATGARAGTGLVGTLPFKRLKPVTQHGFSRAGCMCAARTTKSRLAEPATSIMAVFESKYGRSRLTVAEVSVRLILPQE